MCFLNSLHALVLWRVYGWLSIPRISPGYENPSLDQEYLNFGKALIWVLQCIVPPLFAVQWLTFEIKAISRLFTGDDKFNSKVSTTGKPTIAQLLDRIQMQGFEQTIMTLGVCIALTLVDLRPLDLRLPVAWALTFIVGRPLFVFGYILEPKRGRLFGLFMGGFWMNMSALLYCTWAALGFATGYNIAKRFYFGCMLFISVTISIIFPEKKASKGGRARKVE